MNMNEPPPLVRCAWANPANPLYLRYHDEEWGVPCSDETRLFEMLNLEGAQAGLSWSTILAKRENYRAAFDGWDADAIARYGESDVERLMGDAGIVRNRLKILSTINNARAVSPLIDEFGGMVPYLWSWVGGVPLVNERTAASPAPARTELSDAISSDLSRRGFRFVGSTIVYAYMQAIGMVDDHAAECFRHAGRGTEVGLPP
jgi:DNA-3-methyladenine glycosylase I